MKKMFIRTPEGEPMEINPIEVMATCDLVEELSRREGVKIHRIGPYEDYALSVNGPAVILEIID